MSDLGGLDNFKDWLKLRQKAFSQEALNMGYPIRKVYYCGGSRNW